MTMSNYYPFNPLGIPVGGTYTPDSSRLASTNTVQSGGYKGDILLQDMVNGVRDVGHILGGAYNKYMAWKVLYLLYQRKININLTRVSLMWEVQLEHL